MDFYATTKDNGQGDSETKIIYDMLTREKTLKNMKYPMNLAIKDQEEIS